MFSDRLFVKGNSSNNFLENDFLFLINNMFGDLRRIVYFWMKSNASDGYVHLRPHNVAQ